MRGGGHRSLQWEVRGHLKAPGCARGLRDPHGPGFISLGFDVCLLLFPPRPRVCFLFVHLVQGLVHESERAPGAGDGQGGLACFCSQGRRESDTAERRV